jgi:iron(III) transport system substrate-binding protein
MARWQRQKRIKARYVASLLFLAVPLWAQEKNWEKQWSEILAAARKEGKVVVHGPVVPAARQTIPARFLARFGIPVEYVSGRSSDLAVRLRIERRVGLSTIDVYVSGFSTAATILYPEKMLDPLRPALILPEVVDPSKWKKGKLWFMDPEDRTILRLFNMVSNPFNINTRYVKPEELRVIKDMLDPRWKGRISSYDPTGQGPGRSLVARWYVQFGEEFVRRLYVDQRPVISRDDRQLIDWLVRGTYPIGIGTREEEVDRLRKEGFPVTPHSFVDDMGHTGMADGALALMAKTPHPNAARIFVNWMASKEGLETFARALLAAPTRNDIDESFLPPERIPRPNVKYFDSADWDYTIDTKEKIERRMKEILAPR